MHVSPSQVRAGRSPTGAFAPTARRAALFLQMLLALLPAPPAGAGDEAALAGLLERFLAGASAGDAAVHETFWAEDLVYTSAAGERFGKATILAGLEPQRDPPTAGPRYGAEEVAVRVLGNVAVVTFRLTAEEDGERVGEYFNTGVFRRTAEGWQAFTWQATRIPAPGDP